MGETIISIKDLRKSFGTHEVLKKIDIDINKGEIICIVGSSGSGKSTKYSFSLGHIYSLLNLILQKHIRTLPLLKVYFGNNFFCLLRMYLLLDLEWMALKRLILFL